MTFGRSTSGRRSNAEAVRSSANPSLAASDDFARSALSVGTGYDELLERIMSLGMSYKAEWRATYG